MVVRALFDPLSMLVLLAIVAMVAVAGVWWASGSRQANVLAGGLSVLRTIGLQLAEHHPIRRRLESAAVAELSLEEIARLLRGDEVEPAARALLRLRERLGWIERFAQFSINLGILGTVFALVGSDPTDLQGFRAQLPQALGTTFWGLVGAMALSVTAGMCESILERASVGVRSALLAGLDESESSS